MRALVTGAAGFLGSHMVDALLAEGHSVLGVDNLLTGRIANIQHLGTEPHFQFLSNDITKPFDPGAVDMVFNMASPGESRRLYDSWNRDLNGGVLGYSQCA